jgi:hypothetical protein
MMSIPGFSAEAAVGVSPGLYRGRARPAAPGGVVAQLRRSIGFCMADCDASETNPVSNAACKFDCMEGGGDGGPGGPSEPTCRPGCGPCVDGTRLCVRADCETYERSCFSRPPRGRLS